mgnify:CR=1 FL=1
MKVAVIAVVETYNSGLDENVCLERNITEWTDITQEEYYELVRAIDYMNQSSYNSGLVHKILHFPQKSNDSACLHQKEFILEKISDYKEYLRKKDEEAANARAEEERKKLEKKMKRELKTREQKLKLLEELKKELES